MKANTFKRENDDSNTNTNTANQDNDDVNMNVNMDEKTTQNIITSEDDSL